MTFSATIGASALHHVSRLAGGPRFATATVRTERAARGPWLLALLALVALALSGRAHADCSYTNNPGTVTFTPPGGKIVLSNTGAGIGTVLWTSAQATPANYPVLDCSGATNNGIVSNYGPPTGGDQALFPTNLPWLSFRILHPDSSNLLSAYPNNASVPTGRIRFSVASALQLVVTGTIPQGQQGSTQQMVIPAGQLAQWNVDMFGSSNPVEIFNITNITFVIPTCTAAVDPTVVTLPPVPATAFARKGTTAGQLPFQVQLNCVAGANLRITLSTTSAYSNTLGVINNTAGAGYATNAGVQILQSDGATPVKFGTAISEGATQTGTMNLPFFARYYQTSNRGVTAGQVSATATYTLTYQ
ncbi:MAG: fimbrial protein [Rhodanobacter sp.]|nr:MAG: fimbrial protein [Rhodanobacter sp.]TAM13968.1 MAG: fimbrial protein [Rhodanobacter sp.]TAM36605.1 MAG: fimbrial protein [Rhodanobacter sp.]